MGDMGEVGEEGPAFHREVGAYAAERGIDALFALGDASRDSVNAFNAAASKQAAQHFGDVGELVAALLNAGFGAHATYLAKGSRFMKMERVVDCADDFTTTRCGQRARRTLTHRKRRTSMLLALAQWLQNDASFMRVFTYITFRAVGATATALLIGLVCGPWVIRKLTAMKVGQAVRKDGPQTHLVKSGTPTMGGVLILIGIAVSTLLWADLTNRFVWIVMLVTFGYGVIGWVDDYRKVVHKDPRGMSSREKYFWQSVIGLFAAVYLAFSVSEASNTRVFDLFMAWVRSGLSMGLPARADLMLPFLKSITYPLGVWGFIAMTYFVIVGSSNAVNLTDGLDGLVIMPVVLVGASLGAFAYVMGSSVYSNTCCFRTFRARANC